MYERDLSKNRFRSFIIISLISFIAGGTFTIAINGPTLEALIRGGVIGIIIGGSIVWFELYINIKMSSRFNLVSTVILKSSIYSIVIVGVLLLNSYITVNYFPTDFLDLKESINHPSFKSSIYFSIIITLIIMTLTSVNELIGRGILFKFILGKYHKPREEKKIFMFLDLKNSTEIAESLGHKKYIALIKDFFYDISSPVLYTKGEIYKYVGDEAIITWSYKNGLKSSNCLEFFFYFKSVIKNRSDYYLKKYGFIPQFKAGLHGGEVITGEVGTFKKEITYLGDTVNTTARIEGLCNILKEDLLLSKTLKDNLSIKEHYRIKEYKNIELRGKKERLTLFSIVRE